MRKVSLHGFASVKGGVGKSTLAVTCARMLAAVGRPSVVLDLDFTGTSLADGLRLRAPAVQTEARIDCGAAPTGELLSRDETQRRRKRRRDERDKGVGRYLPYLGDLLTLFDPATNNYPVDWFVWRCEPDDGVMYMPSSPHRHDVRVARTWLLHEAPGAFIQHIAWLIDHLLRAHPELRDVIIDLPPGTLGFSHDVLSLCAKLDAEEDLPEGYPSWRSSIRWTVRPYLVTTEDRNDLLAAMDYFAAQVPYLRSFRAIVNRRVGSVSQIYELIKENLPPGLGIERRVDFVDRDADALGALFRRDDAPRVDDALARQLAGVFVVGGSS